jgi:hypothetical protein
VAGSSSGSGEASEGEGGGLHRAAGPACVADVARPVGGRFYYEVDWTSDWTTRTNEIKERAHSM